MEKLKMRTTDIAAEKFTELARLFPSAVTETIKGYEKDENGNNIISRPIIERAVDPDILRQEINVSVVSDKEERYQFTWPDKRKSIALSNEPITAALRPVRNDETKPTGTDSAGERYCSSGSVDFDNTENLYIEGDNLDVLKLLRETYLNRVKMIYIDPPYNTGNDFIYNDDFSGDASSFLVRDCQYDEDGNRMVRNLDGSGRFHTDWLNMMYPRLRFARDLLTDDGAIFVSIDFNELSNMKKMMDEIFGEENFQREIIWRIGWLSGYKTAAPNFIRNHDVILFYSKNHNNLDFIKKYINNKDFKELVKKEPKITGKMASLGLNVAQQKDLLEFINHTNRPERYPIEDTWNCNEYDDLNSIAIVSFSGEKISKILEIDEEFKGQKSVKMLMRLLGATTRGNDIVMDFFSGTGSTAHAVMQMNLEDGGSRKFIMVQIPEVCGENSAAYKAGYKNICEIGKERIRRAGKKIEEQFLIASRDKRQAETNSALTSKFDAGFRVLKLDSSNMKDVYYTPGEYAQMNFALDGMVDNIKEDRSDEDLLFQVMLDIGIPLSAKIRQDGKTFFVDDNYMIACFDKTDIGIITKIAKMRPKYAVFRDASFTSDGAMVSFEQVFATYSPSTIRRVL